MRRVFSSASSRPEFREPFLHFLLEVVHIDKARGEGDNRGVLDYQKNVARARLNVVVALTGIARLLARAANCEPMPPLRAVLHWEGVITEDHNFGLSGPMEVLPHPLFGPEAVSAVVLPGH
jgi:hypothetical protein